VAFSSFEWPRPLPIGIFSPSLANQLLRCELQAAFARDSRFQYLRRGNTFTTLGSVSHRIIETAFTDPVSQSDTTDVNSRYSELWDLEIALGKSRLDEEWSPSVPPPPIDWPGYQLTRIRTIRRAVKIYSNRPAIPGERIDGTGIEHELRDEVSGLVGRPDRVEYEGGSLHVVDLKTGLNQAEPTPDQFRQLHLYALLVERTTGRWPASIRVENASGNRWETSLDPDDAENALAEVVSAVNRFNSSIDGPEEIGARATPDATRCRWCHYRVVCGKYWDSLSVDWEHRAIFGEIESVAEVAGEKSIRLRVISPSDHPEVEVQVSGLLDSVSGGATDVAIVGWNGGSADRSIRAMWSSDVRVLDDPKSD
jgi:RecB family exonuclease